MLNCQFTDLRKKREKEEKARSEVQDFSMAIQVLPSGELKKRKREKEVKARSVREKEVKARSVVQVDSKSKSTQVLPSGELKLYDGVAVVESSSPADFAIEQAPSPQAKARPQAKQGSRQIGENSKILSELSKNTTKKLASDTWNYLCSKIIL